jgi:hypothetical protein
MLVISDLYLFSLLIVGRIGFMCTFAKPKRHDMNIASGQSAKKQHLVNGSMTACNRRNSGIGLNDFNDFKWWADKHPDACCQKCLNRFTEKLNRKKQSN